MDFSLRDRLMGTGEMQVIWHGVCTD
jgi:hypothetical protein